MTNDDIAFLRLLAEWHDRKTLWAEKIQSITDAGSLNAFGRNEIEVAPISSALLRIACLVIRYKTCRTKNSQPMGYQNRYEDSRSTT
jgi:hypothetical protein